MSERRRSASAQPAMGGGPRGPRAMGPRQPINKESAKRLLTYLKPYWLRLVLVLCCILVNAIATASAATFLGRIIDDYITPLLASPAPEYSGLLYAILQMAALYLLAIAASFTQARVKRFALLQGCFLRLVVLLYRSNLDPLCVIQPERQFVSADHQLHRISHGGEFDNRHIASRNQTHIQEMLPQCAFPAYFFNSCAFARFQFL